LIEGSSSKFWEVARDGCAVTARYGRIGTDGQAKTKELANEELAERHADGLIEAKVAKGYRERNLEQALLQQRAEVRFAYDRGIAERPSAAAKHEVPVGVAPELHLDDIRFGRLAQRKSSA
jgi:predicted DNA-binding WGR domain protein